jgi:hypothetical protein
LRIALLFTDGVGVGRHALGFPDRALRELIARHSVVRRLAQDVAGVGGAVLELLEASEQEVHP